MFFNVEQTQQAILASPMVRENEPVLARAAEGFVVGFLATKLIKKVAPIPVPWPGR